MCYDQEYTIECLEKLPSAQSERLTDGYAGGYAKEEDILKFYYVESIDDYWVGRRLDNFYYATWDKELQNFVWSKSRYLPWGEHVVAPDTLWKEHTYPSEPKEIPFVDWLKGFYAKYFTADIQTEIIRCKECKYWAYIKRTKRHWCKTDEGLYDLNTSADDFCSRAERITEG